MDPSEREVIKNALNLYAWRIGQLLDEQELLVVGAKEALVAERGRAYLALANIRAVENVETIKEQLREKDRERKARDRANIKALTK